MLIKIWKIQGQIEVMNETDFKYLGGKVMKLCFYAWQLQQDYYMYKSGKSQHYPQTRDDGLVKMMGSVEMADWLPWLEKRKYLCSLLTGSPLQTFCIKEKKCELIIYSLGG